MEAISQLGFTFARYVLVCVMLTKPNSDSMRTGPYWMARKASIQTGQVRVKLRKSRVGILEDWEDGGGATHCALSTQKGRSARGWSLKRTLYSC